MSKIPVRRPNSDNSPSHPTPRPRVRRESRQDGSAALLVAQDYAAIGLPVIPLKPGGKRPVTAHGKDDATTDAEQIARWWSEWPMANIVFARRVV